MTRTSHRRQLTENRRHEWFPDLVSSGMTYNFDPDRWLESHRAALEARLKRGEIDAAAFDAALVEIDRRYEEMTARLDGTYEIPAGKHDSHE